MAIGNEGAGPNVSNSPVYTTTFSEQTLASLDGVLFATDGNLTTFGTWDGTAYSIPGGLAITGEYDQYNQAVTNDATNYERGYKRWASNVWTIGTEQGGSGTKRSMAFRVPGNDTTPVTLGFGFSAHSSYAPGLTGFQFIPANAASAGGSLGTGATDFSKRAASTGATGTNAFACNTGTWASGQNAFAANGSGRAAGVNSSVFSYTGYADLFGDFVLGHGSNWNQTRIIGFSGATSSNSAAILLVCGSAAQYATVPVKSFWGFDIRLIAKDAAGTSGSAKYASYLITGDIQRGTTGAPSLLGTPTVTLRTSGGATFLTSAVSVTAGANNDLQIQVTPPTDIGSTALQWTATCIITEASK